MNTKEASMLQLMQRFLAPEFERFMLKRLYDHPFILEDLNAYMSNNNSFKTELLHALLKVGVDPGTVDLGTVKDFRNCPSSCIPTLMQVIVDNARPEFLKMETQQTCTKEREGFLWFICTAFNAYPRTRSWNNITHYFNREAKRRKAQRYFLPPLGKPKLPN